mmetsp:Transcript_10029/g.23263  ORF Transcript_10029/g.23263 Transcript_10029/m.23263 type:complete len:129 (+) Transcript_10029:73-459(+)
MNEAGGRAVILRGMGNCGFFVNSDFVPGSILAFNDLLLSWKVDALEDITPDHFAIASAVDPPLDLIVIGTGASTEPLDPGLLRELRRIAPVEVSSTYHACATFNLMNAEERNVMAAILAVSEEDQEDE